MRPTRTLYFGRHRASWGEGHDQPRNLVTSVVNPRGSADAPDGTVYVAPDCYSGWATDRIQYFDADGDPQGEWGASGSASGQFSHPRGIAAALAGSQYAGRGAAAVRRC